MSAVLGPLPLTCKVKVETSHPLWSYQHASRRGAQQEPYFPNTDDANSIPAHDMTPHRTAG